MCAVNIKLNSVNLILCLMNSDFTTIQNAHHSYTIDLVYCNTAELELLMSRTNDLVEFRIDAVLKEMSNTVLCELPADEPWTVEEFLQRTQVDCQI